MEYEQSYMTYSEISISITRIFNNFSKNVIESKQNLTSLDSNLLKYKFIITF